MLKVATKTKRVDEMQKSYQSGLIEVKLSWSKNIYAEEATYWDALVNTQGDLIFPP